MKKYFTLLVLITFRSFAGESSFLVDSNNENEKLRVLPQQLMATFVDQGFKQKETSKGIFELKIKNLRCDINSRDFLYPDWSNAGLPSVKCFSNTRTEMGSKGKKILEGRYVNTLLGTLSSELNDFNVYDCAMGGKCIAFVKEIKCKIDLNQEEMHNAYSCEFKL